jgi:hypothetical protein
VVELRLHFASCLPHLLVVPQVLLEWQQVSYLLFSTAAPLMPTGASWLALLFVTPASTLHWVPLGCVFPAGQHGAATAAAAILSMLYPGGCAAHLLAAQLPAVLQSYSPRKPVALVLTAAHKLHQQHGGPYLKHAFFFSQLPGSKLCV